LGSGALLVAQLPNGPEFLAAFIACVRLGVTFAPMNPRLSSSEFLERANSVDANAVLATDGSLVRRRSDREAGDPAPVLALFTSGTSGRARAIALGERGLLSVIDTHRAHLRVPSGARIVGCLPWSHAFGFTLELLMGVMSGAQLRSVPPDAFVGVLNESRPDMVFGVPRVVSLIPDGILGSFEGGVVGGSPIRGKLRERLQRTRMRVGYGQTECSPGISLGEPGEWKYDDFLGRPIGCEVRLRAEDECGGTELLVRGDNVAAGVLDGGRLRTIVGPDGWLATGDLAVRTEGGALCFAGRSDERFKLDNGRMVNPVPLEAAYGDRVLLIGAGQPMVQPLVRGDVPEGFDLPVPHYPPLSMPESFWTACTTSSGKVSRWRAEELFQAA
jgi:long-subunit acyl-CoA synthetase (AMP-forming)